MLLIICMLGLAGLNAYIGEYDHAMMWIAISIVSFTSHSHINTQP